MEVSGHKSGASALNLVRPRSKFIPGKSLGNDRRIRWLHSNRLKRFLSRFDHLVRSRQCATGTNTGDDDVHCSIRVVPNFLGCSFAVDFRVGGIIELLWNPGIFGLGRQLFSHRNGPLHALGRGCQNQFGAQHSQQSASLNTHALGHGKDELVALGGSDKGQRNAGIAAGGLNNDGVLRKCAISLGGLDHRHADAILHAGKRVKEFAFNQHAGIEAFGHFVQADQGRVADGLHNGVINFRHEDLGWRI